MRSRSEANLVRRCLVCHVNSLTHVPVRRPNGEEIEICEPCLRRGHDDVERLGVTLAAWLERALLEGLPRQAETA